MIAQEVHTFVGTIRDNVAMPVPDASAAAIDYAKSRSRTGYQQTSAFGPNTNQTSDPKSEPSFDASAAETLASSSANVNQWIRFTFSIS